ncbi:hypothetical protein CRYUN_Cryun06bG0129100 [Craigia yunnanensis]
MKGGGLEALGLGGGVESCGCMCIGLENMPKATSNTPRSSSWQQRFERCASKFLERSIHGNEEMSESNGSLWSKLLVAQSKRRLKVKKQRITRKKARHVRCKRPRRILMKRRAHPEDYRRPANPLENKLKTLKKLIPNNESMSLDGLFRETAEYILSLQMRVEVMLIMVKVLTGGKFKLNRLANEKTKNQKNGDTE